MSFEAKYVGWCDECGSRFGVGDQISGNPMDGYRHETCEPKEPRNAPICPQCWLAISPSGACGCEPA